MEGKDEPAQLRGIIPNTFQYIFDTIASNSERHGWSRGSGHPHLARQASLPELPGGWLRLASSPAGRKTAHPAHRSPTPLTPNRHCTCAGGGTEYLVRASYLEIYNEEIRDLMGRNPEARLELKESGERGVYVRDLTQFVVKNVVEINQVLQVGGEGQRAGGRTESRGGSRGWAVGRRGTEEGRAGGLAMATARQAAAAAVCTCRAWYV